MKRTLTVIMVCMLSLAAVFAGGAGETAGSEEKQELKIFLPQSPGVQEGVQAIADKFIEMNPGVTITIRTVPNAKYSEQLTVMWSSSEVDDIVMLAASEATTRAAQGCLLPLDSIMTGEYRSAFLESSLNAAVYDGHYYSVPFKESASAMYYNKTLFALAGIEPATIDDPWTWEEFRENMLKLRDTVKEKTGEDVWGLTFMTNPGQGDFWMTAIARSAGEKGSNTYKYISDDGMTLTGYADTEEALHAYHFIQDLYTVDKLAPNADVPDAFGTGKAATFVSFLATAANLEKNFPDLEWGLMPMPYFTTPVVQTGGISYEVSAKSKSPELAKRFVEFAASEEGVMTYFDAVGGELVSLKGFSERHPEYYTSQASVFFSQILNLYGEGRPSSPAYAIFNSVMGFGFWPDIAKGADVETTLREKIGIFEQQAVNL